MSDININREFSEFGKCCYYLALCMILNFIPYVNYVAGFIWLYFFIKSLKVIKRINSQMNNENLTVWRSKMILAVVVLVVGVIVAMILMFVFIGISFQAGVEPDVAAIGTVIFVLILTLVLVSISGYLQMIAWDNLNVFFEGNRNLFPEIVLVDCLDGTKKLKTGAKFQILAFLLIPAIIGFIFTIVGLFKLAILRNLEAVSEEGPMMQPTPVAKPEVIPEEEPEVAEAIQFCGNCGAKLEPSWRMCPNCGSPVGGEATYQPPSGQPYPPEYEPKKGKTYGSLALAFGLLSLCCCCGACFGPLAILFGVLGIFKDEDRSLSIIGLILALIGTICGIIFVLFFVQYMGPTPA